MTAPTDISTLAWEVLLTSANYSGGAGGTFTDNVTGGEDWTVSSATPTFETRGGVSGMVFSNDATQAVQSASNFQGAMSVMAICDTDATGSQMVWGNTNTTTNDAALNINAFRAQALAANASSGLTANFGTGIVSVGITFDPQEERSWVSAWNGTSWFRSDTAHSLLYAHDEPVSQIGRSRTTNYTGWIHKVIGFHEPLHRTQNAAFEDLILTEAGLVGL